MVNHDGSENIIDVKVDNSAQPSSRWYSGSGITRNVWIYGVKRLHVAPYGVWVRQPEVTKEQAKLIVETQVCMSSADLSDGDKALKAGKICVETCIYTSDGTLCVQERTQDGRNIDGERIIFTQDICVKAPRLWDISDPALYKVITSVWENEELQDEVELMTGFRSAVFDSDKGFLLNGKRVKLNGVCIHHDGGCAGAAVHPQIWERRLEKLKNMGANAVRMSHNPAGSRHCWIYVTVWDCW